MTTDELTRTLLALKLGSIASYIDARKHRITGAGFVDTNLLRVSFRMHFLELQGEIADPLVASTLKPCPGGKSMALLTLDIRTPLIDFGPVAKFKLSEAAV